MPWRNKIKTKGKIGISLLFMMIIFVSSGLVYTNEIQAAKKVDLQLEQSLQTLSFSSEPVPVFSDSALSQSIIEEEMKKIEAAREEEIAKQHRLDRQEHVIYLTFDDGPSPVSEQLLDILNDFNMKATFFMMGPKMKDNPEIVKRKQEEGHGLALHGMTHDVGQVYADQYAPSEEMIEGQEILESITGIRTEVIRLPYGSVPYLTEPMRYVLDQNGFKVWDWNVDSLDWKFNNSKYVQHTIQEIENTEKAGEAPIILLHDREETVKHLPKLLSYIKKQGYQTKILTNDMEPYTFSCNGNCRTIH